MKAHGGVWLYSSTNTRRRLYLELVTGRDCRVPILVELNCINKDHVQVIS